MEIIRPSFEVLCMTNHPELPYSYYDKPEKLIEAAGRTCYKSEDKTTAESARAFVEKLRNLKHLTALEHSWQARGYHSFPVIGDWSKYLYISECIFEEESTGSRYRVVCGNIRAFEEAEKKKEELKYHHYFLLSEKELYEDSTMTDGWQPQLLRATVRLINDRGVSHETVRHRPPAFSQESTRYVNYSKGGAQFLLPPWVSWRNCRPAAIFNKARRADFLWFTACWLSEKIYNLLLKYGWTPQQARSVLINSLKTEMVVSATFAEWQHIFRQRALGLTGKPHPQMEEIMVPLQKEFAEMEPTFFGDQVLLDPVILKYEIGG